MKKYYGFGFLIAIVGFFLALAIAGISSCTKANNQIDSDKNYGQNTIIVRYYMDNDIENARISFLRLRKEDNKVGSKLETMPTKKGYTFAGLYDGTDYINSNWYVGSDGSIMQPLYDGIILYSIFNVNEEAAQ